MGFLPWWDGPLFPAVAAQLASYPFVDIAQRTQHLGNIEVRFQRSWGLLAPRQQYLCWCLAYDESVPATLSLGDAPIRATLAAPLFEFAFFAVRDRGRILQHRGPHLIPACEDAKNDFVLSTRYAEVPDSDHSRVVRAILPLARPRFLKNVGKLISRGSVITVQSLTREVRKASLHFVEIHHARASKLLCARHRDIGMLHQECKRKAYEIHGPPVCPSLTRRDVAVRVNAVPRTVRRGRTLRAIREGHGDPLRPEEWP